MRTVSEAQAEREAKAFLRPLSDGEVSESLEFRVKTNARFWAGLLARRDFREIRRQVNRHRREEALSTALREWAKENIAQFDANRKAWVTIK
jgi:hypothetical protein